MFRICRLGIRKHFFVSPQFLWRELSYWEAGWHGKRFVKGAVQPCQFKNLVYSIAEEFRFLSELQTPLKDGDDVMIIPLIAGGKFAVY